MSNKTSGAFCSRLELARDFARFKHQPPVGFIEAIEGLTNTDADKEAHDRKQTQSAVRASLKGDPVAWAQLRREHVSDELPGSSTTTAELRLLMERGGF